MPYPLIKTFKFSLSPLVSDWKLCLKDSPDKGIAHYVGACRDRSDQVGGCVCVWGGGGGGGRKVNKIEKHLFGLTHSIYPR